MLFNSLQFWAFFALVYTLYRVSGHRWQNRLLLGASYLFYGAWDWRFLFLLAASTVVDFICAAHIHRSDAPRVRKFYLWVSIGFGLTVLGFFKYFNFFAESLSRLAEFFGLPLHPLLLNVVLPVGISFYTFQTMGYVIDVYRKRTPPAENIFDFALFVSFFPQLVAGPIERAGHLLPQILAPRTITREGLKTGAYLIFWGLFQKLFVADNLAGLVDPFFASAAPYNGVGVLLAVYAFSFQIYCDFAGYSNIARGLGLFMGFDLMVNFNLPFFSRNPRELWERWHISLAQWVRDYVYAPTRSVLATMALVGLWHGAAWTYILWGLYHGTLLALHRALASVRKPSERFTVLKILGFFHLWCLGALIFRSGSLTQLAEMLSGLLFRFTPQAGSWKTVLSLAYFTFFLLAVETVQFKKKDLLVFRKWPLPVKTIFVLCALYLMLYVEILGKFSDNGGSRAFIYFQF